MNHIRNKKRRKGGSILLVLFVDKNNVQITDKGMIMLTRGESSTNYKNQKENKLDYIHVFDNLTIDLKTLEFREFRLNTKIIERFLNLITNKFITLI